ncbi:MAG: hypothetical protein IJH04_00025 [Eggerthellaceae bacterium]|nr:hypothetical protein [Eggerthellaceae bacterium]
MRRERVALALNVFIAVMEPVAWGMMVFSRGAAALTAVGLYSLKYFTVLSNLLLGFASFAYAYCLFKSTRGGKPVLFWAHCLKFVATTAVTVTLMTVLVFLGPRLGYASMFAGANLWFHLVLPVLAIFEFVLLDTSFGLTFRQSLLGVLPTLVYGVFYYGNILLNGVGKWPNTNDWYGFTLFGEQFMPVVMLVMLLLTWVIALVLRAGNAFVRKRVVPPEVAD